MMITECSGIHQNVIGSQIKYQTCFKLFSTNFKAPSVDLFQSKRCLPHVVPAWILYTLCLFKPLPSACQSLPGLVLHGLKGLCKGLLFNCSIDTITVFVYLYLYLYLYSCICELNTYNQLW